MPRTVRLLALLLVPCGAASLLVLPGRADTPPADLLRSAVPGVGTIAAEGLKAAEGFEVTVYAGDELVHDAGCLTIDSAGRVVVSGPGYVRILVDENGDGRADAAIPFADGPKTGAQGLCFDGSDLLAVGDAGLIRYRDADADGRADGPPETLLKLKVGGEHHAHAVRRGPDGWWYVLCGNETGVTAADVIGPHSPVVAPEAGVLLRLTPDFQQVEVVADGLRNAYDFDFTAGGDAITYDSDDEREVSLPWYRPTRVFRLTPGSNAGWFSKSWKRPDAYPEMPETLARLGRGSPTGVAVYRHSQFPWVLRSRAFVCDWTFGRVVAVSEDDAPPIDFLTATGTAGFAPTDLAVGPDGSLYISVGGRGTNGSVYRVRFHGNVDQNPFLPPDPKRKLQIGCHIDPAYALRRSDDPLHRLLVAEQPLDAWSRAEWEPLVRSQPPTVWRSWLNARSWPTSSELRAVELLAEFHGGLLPSDAGRFQDESVSTFRAHVAWAIGVGFRNPDRKTPPTAEEVAALRPLIADESPLVRRAALEALAEAYPLPPGEGPDATAILNPLLAAFGDADPNVRKAAMHVVNRLPEKAREVLGFRTRSGAGRRVRFHLGRLRKNRVFDADGLDAAIAVLETNGLSAALRYDAVRLAQLSLGDVGPTERTPDTFSGYAARADLSQHEDAIAWQRKRLVALFPTGDEAADHEFVRLLAMLRPDDAGVLSRVLDRITPESHPTLDLHHLFAVARLSAARSPRETALVAVSLLSLDAKLAVRGLNLDNKWNERLSDLFAALAAADPALSAAVVQHAEFGRPGHVVFTTGLPPDLRREAAAAVLRASAADDDYRWTPEAVDLLGRSDDMAVRNRVRELFDAEPAVAGAALSVLASMPDAADRGRFVSGLAAPQIDAAERAVAALESLGSSDAPAAQIARAAALRRLDRDAREYALRDRVARLLLRSGDSDETFGFAFGKEGFRPQGAVRDWSRAVEGRYPQLAKSGDADGAEVARRIAAAATLAGDAARGRSLYEARGCARCHAGGTVGPDLAGVSGRFSRDDLFTAMTDPDRDVSSRYRGTLLGTTDGRIVSGLVVYESADGVLLKDGEAKTVRIPAAEIEYRKPLETSLMPRGLLRDLTPQNLADLEAHIRTFGRGR